MNCVRNISALLAFFLFCAAPCRAESGKLKNYELGQWKLGFGMEDRVRVEQKKDFDFNEHVQDNGALVFQRFTLAGRATLKDQYEVFASGVDSRVYSAHIKRTDQTDAFDLRQAYMSANKIAGSRFDLKIGRQVMKYGKARLISGSAWGNRENHFDAAVLRYKAEGLYADLLYGSRVRYLDHSFNEWNRHDMLSGAYVGYQKNMDAPLVETYFFSNQNLGSIRTLNRHTVGVRTQATAPGKIVCELEIPYQFGKNAGVEISAYALHFDAARSFHTAWTPTLTATYNLATGDRTPGNRSHTFVPLFQATTEPYGRMDLFRWQNMREAALEGSLTPNKKWKLISATNFFWLDSYRDSWYDSTGRKLRTMTAGKARHYVGQEASLIAKYDLSGPVKLETGYAHFFSGKYVKDTGAYDDADWVYFQANLKI